MFPLFQKKPIEVNNDATVVVWWCNTLKYIELIQGSISYCDHASTQWQAIPRQQIHGKATLVVSKREKKNPHLHNICFQFIWASKHLLITVRSKSATFHKLYEIALSILFVIFICITVSCCTEKLLILHTQKEWYSKTTYWNEICILGFPLHLFKSYIQSL